MLKQKLGRWTGDRRCPWTRCCSFIIYSASHTVYEVLRRSLERSTPWSGLGHSAKPPGFIRGVVFAQRTSPLRVSTLNPSSATYQLLFRDNNMDAQAYRSGVHKFSSKPPGHDAARQRENQRRHRARVKGRIAELEAALEDALQRIGDLTAEVNRLQHALDGSKTSPDKTTVTLPLDSANPPNPAIPDLATPPPQTNEPPTTNITCNHPPNSPATTPSATDHPAPNTAQLAADFQDPTSDCPLLPAPGAGESTIPCRDAYAMVTDRTPPEFDLAAAAEWLRPGFRRAPAPGAGCRVQTHLLFALVDRLTAG